MEPHLPLELEGTLVAAASRRRGVSAEVLAREALERAVDYDDWFIREVETIQACSPPCRASYSLRRKQSRPLYNCSHRRSIVVALPYTL
jgi:hypothetical protein